MENNFPEVQSGSIAGRGVLSTLVCLVLRVPAFVFVFCGFEEDSHFEGPL